MPLRQMIMWLTKIYNMKLFGKKWPLSAHVELENVN